MSNRITFFSKADITIEKLKIFVIGIDQGHWLQHGFLQGSLVEDGVISGDNGENIYIYHDGVNFLEAYADEDINKIVKKIGGIPKSSITIQIGHNDGSRKLALHFSEKLLEKWGGVIDE